MCARIERNFEYISFTKLRMSTLGLLVEIAWNIFN